MRDMRRLPTSQQATKALIETLDYSLFPDYLQKCKKSSTFVPDLKY